MRTSKIAALVAATALLVVGSAIAAMAATTGWVEESGAWKYYKNGEAQTECFAKSGDNWYWLDEQGEMATDKLISYNDNIYYVNENGVMVTNDWKKLPNTDDDDFGSDVYYYFQSTGKAYKNTSGKTEWKTINGKKYAFNDAGKMLYGWVSDTATLCDDSENKAYQNNNNGYYYCGAADDGARVTSDWRKLYCVLDDNDDGEKWFYFGTNGKKYMDNKTGKSINGKKYAFSEDGIMLAEWVDYATTSESSAANYSWFQDVENGAKYANGWFKTVPTATLNSVDYTAEDQHWYYADGKGNLVSSCIKTIKGKQYAFNEKGEMVTGLRWTNADCTTFEDVEEVIETVIDPADTKYVADGKKGLHYFSTDADNDGSMKTGSVTVSANGDSYTLKLGTSGTSKGVGINGKDGNYVYCNGYKLAADADYKVGLIETKNDESAKTAKYADAKAVTIGSVLKTMATDPKDTSLDKYWVVSSSGSIVKNGTKTDSDGYKVTAKNYLITSIIDTNYDKTETAKYTRYTRTE